MSDLHFGRFAVPLQVDAIERMIDERHFDVVAVSGDVTQRARAGEFLRASVFLRDADRVSRTIVVPGNHDVMWWTAPMRQQHTDPIYRSWRKYIGREVEPVLRVPGATLVGLNTAQGVTARTLTWNMRDLSVIGDLRPSQVERAAAHFAASPIGDARVIVMHHNPVKGTLSRRHGLKHTKQILGAFAEIGVDLVLCGHDHQEAIHLVSHTRKGTIISTAGTVSTRSRGGRPSSVNLITIRDGEIAVTTHVWAGDAKGFVEGPSECFPR